MQSKNEVIEIIKARIENAIKGNDVYEITITNDNGKIKIEDTFGEDYLVYKAEPVTPGIYILTNPPKNHIEEIAVNTNTIAANIKWINSRLEDIRALLTDHRVREVFKQSQCNHIIGTTRNSEDKRIFLANQAEQIPPFKLIHRFKFCPECGTQL
jgi:hypothetical protein